MKLSSISSSELFRAQLSYLHWWETPKRRWQFLKNSKEIQSIKTNNQTRRFQIFKNPKAEKKTSNNQDNKQTTKQEDNDYWKPIKRIKTNNTLQLIQAIALPNLFSPNTHRQKGESLLVAQKNLEKQNNRKSYNKTLTFSFSTSLASPSFLIRPPSHAPFLNPTQCSTISQSSTRTLGWGFSTNLWESSLGGEKHRSTLSPTPSKPNEVNGWGFGRNGVVGFRRGSEDGRLREEMASSSTRMASSKKFSSHSSIPSRLISGDRRRSFPGRWKPALGERTGESWEAGFQGRHLYRALAVLKHVRCFTIRALLFKINYYYYYFEHFKY